MKSNRLHQEGLAYDLNELQHQHFNLLSNLNLEQLHIYQQNKASMHNNEGACSS